MAKLKNAVITAQETADIIGANESLLWRARNALTATIDGQSTTAGAEYALTLINAYLMEVELCKR